MKSLKFSSDQIDKINEGQYTKTWRLFDDKDLNVGDKLIFINSNTGQSFGQATISKITIKRLSEINDEDRKGHKPYGSFDEIASDFRKYYRKQVKLDTVVKIVEYDFIQKNSKNSVVDSTINLDEIKIFTDGGSRGNPGPSACAYVITDMQGNVVENNGLYLGITTNNQAEYQAVRAALKAAKALKSKIIHFYLDSLLVVNQLNGIFKIKNRDLWPIHQEIKEASLEFDKVVYTHIPREMNKLADQKVNEILDRTSKEGIGSGLI